MNFSISSSSAIKLCAAVFVLTGVVLAGASEYVLRSQIAPQDEFIAHTQMFNSNRSANAAFGDSHVARGFVPPGGMLNLAYPSESIPRMAWKVETYFNAHAPGRVIIQADPHMFAPYRLGQGVGNYPEQFKNPSGSETGLLLSIPRYRANLVNYWASFTRKGGRLKSEITFTEGGAHLSPGDISKEPVRFRRFAALNRVRTHDLGPVTAQQDYRETYARMLTELESKGANICMVTFPLSPDYKVALESLNDAERAELLAFFQIQAKRTGARYVNWDNATERLSDFRDTDHLNGEAAKRLSPDLMARCFK